MSPNELTRLQRLLGILVLGLHQALLDGLMSIDEAESLLFSPKTMRMLQGVGTMQELVDLVHLGTKLENI